MFGWRDEFEEIDLEVNMRLFELKER